MVAIRPCALDEDAGAGVPRILRCTKRRPGRRADRCRRSAHRGGSRQVLGPGWIIAWYAPASRPTNELADPRSDRVPRRAFAAHIRRLLAQRADRPPRRRAMEGPVLAGCRSRDSCCSIWGLRPGAGRHAGAVAAAVLDALSGRDIHAGRVRAGRGGVRARHADQERAASSDDPRRQILGVRPPDRQRHAGRRRAVRQLSRLGDRRFRRIAAARSRRRDRLPGGHGGARCDRHRDRRRRPGRYSRSICTSGGSACGRSADLPMRLSEPAIVRRRGACCALLDGRMRRREAVGGQSTRRAGGAAAAPSALPDPRRERPVAGARQRPLSQHQRRHGRSGALARPGRAAKPAATGSQGARQGRCDVRAAGAAAGQGSAGVRGGKAAGAAAAGSQVAGDASSRKPRRSAC